MPTLADSNRVALRGVKETTFGQTPAAALHEFRYVSHSLGAKSTYITSNELRSDRQRSDTIRTGNTSDGEVAFELSYGGTGTNIGIDYYIEGAMQSVFSSALSRSAITIAAASGDNSITDSGSLMPAFPVGSWVVVKGFTTNGAKVYGRVVSRTDGKVVLSGVTLTTETEGATITIAQDGNIRNGTTATSYTLESDFADLGSTFFTHVGMRVNTMAVNVQSGAIVTGSFGFMGTATTVRETTAGTGTAHAAPAYDILSAQSNIGTVYEGAISSTAYATTDLPATTSLYFRQLNFTLNNNLRNQEAIANLYPVGIGTGTIDLTMNTQAYFSNKTTYNKFINNTVTAIAFRVDGQTGGSYIFEFPMVRFTTGTTVPPGINQDIMIDLQATAYRHPVGGYTFQITKLPV